VFAVTREGHKGGHGGSCKVELTPHELEKCLHEQKDGLLITNGEGIGLWVNRAMRRVVGLTPDYFLNKPIKHLFESGIFQYQAVTERARCGRNELTDIQAISTGNTVLVTSIPLMNKQGQIEYMITNVRNMAQLRQHPGSVPEGVAADPAPVLRRLGIVYRSAAMQRVIRLAARVAPTDATVLLTGETGVGKELIARLIHELSPRHARPFLKLNCAALPRDLAESELFGYEPGAFTGARAGGKAGLFEAANGGTLLLDEIGEMSLEMQTKLLRVLQDQEILRLGGTRGISINVRVLAATNADLRSLVSEKRFRPDLYHRLNVVPLEVPPLRTRPEDVALLLGYYLSIYCRKYGVNRKFTPEVFRILLSYTWPGNVRELANMVHRFVLTSESSEITPDLLPEYLTLDTTGATTTASVLALRDPTIADSLSSLQEVMANVEKEVLEAALRQARGIRDASRKLGISHSTLVAKMRKYNLQKPT
ncbi:MAG: sigma 54-interacting transcriptional regulator, partial [Clostridia bacterium]|nr:sigma 54-interacting transcriptional regulator [Clostridia bacterium]